ncbi:hypothetical protein XA68_11280 [Ophiocordyceps unilateralis]|uniref:Uncharacterized protein n=1 Tax=Ophiocordyceps unilateralis TaxID=268505 RepID=A0A2A9NXG3_OPHUN|nr:hypothetical protein XA68_11280 [Ophiocordyceps unilateralis]
MKLLLRPRIPAGDLQKPSPITSTIHSTPIPSPTISGALPRSGIAADGGPFVGKGFPPPPSLCPPPSFSSSLPTRRHQAPTAFVVPEAHQTLVLMRSIVSICRIHAPTVSGTWILLASVGLPATEVDATSGCARRHATPFHCNVHYNYMSHHHNHNARHNCSGTSG